MPENAQEKARPLHQNPGQKKEVLRRRILLVDDQEMARRNLKKILEENSDFEVDTAPDGRIALEKLTQGPFSLVITDLCMPHLGGLEFIQEVQDRRLPTT